MNEQFHNVDKKLIDLEMKISALSGATMMQQAKLAPQIIADIVDLIRDLRNELRSKI